MNSYYVLLIICYELSENRIFVSMKPTYEPFTTPPENYRTENCSFDSAQKRDMENGTSLYTIPKISDFSEICPNSSCLNNITENRNVVPPLRGCYCDKLCIGLRDCCKDSEFYDEEEQRKPRTLDCDNNGKVLYEYGGFYVERGCPLSWEDLEFVEKCNMSRNMDLNTANLLLKMPVTSRSTGVTYGNIFCAICNNDDNFIVWNINIYDCVFDEKNIKVTAILDNGNDSLVREVEDKNGSTKMENIEYTNNKIVENTTQPKNSLDLKFNGKHWYITENQTEHDCKIILSKPQDIKLNICLPNEGFKFLIIHSCEKNWTNPTVLSQCHGAYNLVYHNIPGKTSQIFKNKYCAYCNGLNDTQISCQGSTIGVAGGTSHFGGRPLSVTFDFNFDFSNTEYCRIAWAKGKNMTASERRFCPMDAQKSEVLKKTSNWFFTSYTSIALLVSLILLICHLTVFTVVEKLHTIGGKIIASFCLALILAYSNFLAGNYLEGNACFVVSIVTYYSFLSAFSWMLTISFDIWKTFRDLTKKLKSPRNLKYKFLKYSIWSWTMPALVVSTAVYFDLSKSHPAIAPHFGENGCWFYNGYSLFLFFVLPVSVIILINFVLFLHVSLILRGNQCESANQKAYVDFKLYTRIGLLTGFTWITGFIAGYFQNIVIWYIFIFLNTGQGFLIFLCFTCKKEIISIALQKIGLSSC